MKVAIVLLVALVWAVPAHADADGVEQIAFRGRHLIALNVGVLTDAASSASVSAGDGVSIDAAGNGVLAGLRYSYWFAEDLALDLGVGVMDTDASVRVEGWSETTQASTVTRLLFGVRYEPARLAMARNMRPYLVGSIASYSGNQSGVHSGITPGLSVVEIGSYSDTAVGGRVVVGVDALVATRLDLGVEVGYGFVSDFEREIGGQVNYSSPEFLFTLGVSLGGGS